MSCKFFFKNNFLQKDQNHSFISLVPKLSGSHTVHQFRPISLCNIFYKIISKILANILKVHMHKIIFPFRSAFVSKRNIKDNTILVGVSKKIREPKPESETGVPVPVPVWKNQKPGAPVPVPGFYRVTGNRVKYIYIFIFYFLFLVRALHFTI